MHDVKTYDKAFRVLWDNIMECTFQRDYYSDISCRNFCPRGDTCSGDHYDTEACIKKVLDAFTED